MKSIILAAIAGLTLAMVPALEGITFGPFGPHGEGGTINGQTFTIGQGGSVFELEGFLSVGGMDLNGAQYGASAELSRNALPAGMGLGFTTNLTSDLSDLILQYTFTNNTATAFSNVVFYVLLDAEIDESLNTFYNEYGLTSGTAGQHGYDASQWQIDEPGFQTGTLLKNIFLGTLDNSNSVPSSAPNDVAASLGFQLGTINPGVAAAVQIMISEKGHTISGFSFSHHDSAPSSSATVITMSGVIVATPSEMINPSGPLLVLTGQVFRDANTNGPPNPSGIGISGVTVSLASNAVPVMTSTTDGTGRYAFSVPPGLQPGTYSVTAAASGSLSFTPVPSSQIPNFATANPASTTLPAAIPILNFDFRGSPAQQFENAGGILKWGVSAWRLNYSTGSFLGTLSITNPASSGANFGPPWQLGLQSSTNFMYAHPFGTLPDGVTNIDVSTAVSAQVPNGILSPGQSVILTNAVEVYSRVRNAPGSSSFEIWAAQQ